jgi:hypothetical protein
MMGMGDRSDKKKGAEQEDRGYKKKEDAKEAMLQERRRSKELTVLKSRGKHKQHQQAGHRPS